MDSSSSENAALSASPARDLLDGEPCSDGTMEGQGGRRGLVTTGGRGGRRGRLATGGTSALSLSSLV